MLSIVERPPLRTFATIETPAGNIYRWGTDAPGIGDVVSDLRYSSVNLGGYETCEGTLARDPRQAWPDLVRLSTINVYDGTGAKVWEGRLEDTPRTSGDRMAVSPGAVGYQAHLSDDRSAVIPYIDRDLSKWNEPATARRGVVNAFGGIFNGETGTADADPAGADSPSIFTRFSRVQGGTSNWIELWYQGGGALLDTVVASIDSNGITPGPTHRSVLQLSDDEIATTFDESTDTDGGSSAFIAVTSTGDRRYAVVLFQAGAVGATDVNWELLWANLYVLGNHGVTARGSFPDQGFFDSDIAEHAVSTWAPLLNTDGIQEGSFVIPHLSFTEPTTPAEIIKAVMRFSVREWGVWDDKTFHLHDRGARPGSKSWIARVGDADLEETGPSAKRLANKVLVQYQDVDGTNRTVGPPGSGAHTEDASLEDDDSNNPANQLGIDKYPEDGVLNMGVATAQAAITVGALFLEEFNQLDKSGRARLTGYVEDDKGTLRPYSQVQGGDSIRFVDAGDTSERFIVRADHSDANHSVSVDLDAPSEGVQALLERFQVNLTRAGL